MPANGTNRLRTRPSLLARLKDWNDDESWQEFNDLYRGLLHSFSLTQGVGEDDVEDVIQSTMLSVANAFRAGQFDPQKGSFKSWLLTITRNRIIDHVRRRPRWRKAAQASRTDAAGTATVERVADPRSLTPEAIWDAEWTNNVMELALEELKAKADPKHFQIFHLRKIKEMPTEKVAKSLGVSERYVHLVTFRLKVKLARANRNLQQELEARPERIRVQRLRGRGAHG